MSASPLSTTSAGTSGSGVTLDAVLRQAARLRSSLAPLGASNIAVFGSVARRDEREDSDVDLLVDLEDGVGLFALLRMQSIAEEILGKPVDLVPRSALKPSVAERVRREAVPL